MAFVTVRSDKVAHKIAAAGVQLTFQASADAARQAQAAHRGTLAQARYDTAAGNLRSAAALLSTDRPIGLSMLNSYIEADVFAPDQLLAARNLVRDITGPPPP